MPNPIIHFRLPQADRDKLAARAKLFGGDLSDVMRDAVHSYLYPDRGGADSPPVLVHCLQCAAKVETASWGLTFTIPPSGVPNPQIVFECAVCGADGITLIASFTGADPDIYPREQPGALREGTALNWREAVSMVEHLAGVINKRGLEVRNELLGQLVANGQNIPALAELTGLKQETIRRIAEPYRKSAERQRRRQTAPVSQPRNPQPAPPHLPPPAGPKAASRPSTQRRMSAAALERAHRANDEAELRRQGLNTR